MTTTTEQLAYSQQEAARLLSVSTVTLRAWEKSGKLVPARIDGVILYTRPLLDRFLNRIAVPPVTVSDRA